MNISVVTGLLPTKGIPLPFVSNGGSSLLINLVAMGILLNISQQASSAAAARARPPSDWASSGQEAEGVNGRANRPEARLSVVIAGGGTGGHLYPGIAVAREIVRRVPDARVTFAGTARGLEARVVPREGFELDLIRSAGLKGKSLARGCAGAALHRPPSLLDAWRILSRRRPDVVIGVGGYSSGPVVLVAALARHADDGARAERGARVDQSAAGALRARGGGDVRRDAARSFAGGAFVTGNPVRAEFFAPIDRRRGRRGRPRRGCWSLAARRARTRSTWPWWRRRRSWHGST